jgi:hypothetical protein
MDQDRYGRYMGKSTRIEWNLMECNGRDRNDVISDSKKESSKIAGRQ